MARKHICPTPPPSPSLVAVPGGGFGLGLPYLPCRGGGGGATPTYMAQNDPHVALIIFDYTYVGENFFVKKIFRAKICVPAPLVATSVLTQNKGPGTEAHFWNPPPPFLRRAPMPSPLCKAIFGPPRHSSARARLIFRSFLGSEQKLVGCAVRTACHTFGCQV